MEAKDISTNIHETLSSLVKWEERPQLDWQRETVSLSPQRHTPEGKVTEMQPLGEFPKV